MTVTPPRRLGTPDDIRDMHKRVRILEALKVLAAADDSAATGLQDVLDSKPGLAGFWKLNESSGSTAADSSGNGHDMTVPAGGYIAPTWAQAAGPPAEQSALGVLEPAGSNAGTRLVTNTTSALTDNFSAGLWVKPTNLTQFCELIGQGFSLHGSTGWMLAIDQTVDKFALLYDAVEIIFANSAHVAGTWYLVGFTRHAGTTTMYVNGLAQASTSAVAPTGGNTATYLFDCGFSTAATHGCDSTLSYAFLYDQPLSAGDWLEIQNAATYAGTFPDRFAWMTDGLGSASWQKPIRVNY